VFRKGLDLRRREVQVENQRLRSKLHRLDNGLRKPPLPDHVPGLGQAALNHRFHDFDAGAGREFRQFSNRFLSSASWGVRDMHQHGPLAAIPCQSRSAKTGKLIFESIHRGKEIVLQLVNGNWRQHLPGMSIASPGQQMGGIQPAGKPVPQHLERSNEIKPQESKVCKIIIVQRFVVQVRVDQAQPAEARASPAISGKVRQEHRARISNDAGPDVAPAIDQHTHLALDFAGNLRESARQFHSDKMLRGGLAVAQFL